ncbi:MAG: GntR family transcriptional regulator [Thermodesulfobacteriota bacterium]
MKPAAQPSDIFAPLPRSARSSELLAAEICRVIVNGQIKPGENLPSERDLAVRFHVTRNTVREALRSLEKLRLVSVRQGSRITVLDYLESAGLEFVAEILSTADRPETRLMADIAAAWSVIGSAMMLYAVENADPERLPEIRAAVSAFRAEAEAPKPDVRLLQKLDFTIQNLLMRASGNRVLTFLHNSIRHIYEKIEDLFSPIVANPIKLAENYEALAACLESGDRDRAKQLINDYFRKGRENLVRQTS